jgi:hypothetical protein
VQPDDKSIKDLPLELWDEVVSRIDCRRLHEIPIHNLTASQRTSFRQSVIQKIADKTRDVITALDDCPYKVVGSEGNNNYKPKEIDKYLEWACRCRGLIERVKVWKAYEQAIKVCIL